MFLVVAAEKTGGPALGVLHLAEGGFDLPRLGDQPVLACVPDVNDKIVFKGNRIALSQLPDLLLFDLSGRK